MTKLHPVTIQVSGRLQYVYERINVNNRKYEILIVVYVVFFSVRQGEM